MTIAEAIQKLETHKEYIPPHGWFTKEAINMAIEALEKIENDETCVGCRYYENLENWRNPYSLPGPCDQCRRCRLDMYEENKK